ncbi:MAG TPA: type IV pilus secretin PilQ, partial [Pyrodictium sp.]|nr:type IV pilus secretin PilQ [Pyrodictium sp.]
GIDPAHEVLVVAAKTRRGEKGEGRIIVKLSRPGTPVDVRLEGGRIVAEFLDTSLPERLARRLDVVDFATPVKLVDTYADGANVRMVVTAVGDYDHVAYQSDDVYTIEVKPVPKAERERRRKEKLGYTGERLSLNFQDIEVRAVLQLIADFTGLNVVVSDTVKGSITLRLKNVPWDQALDIILKTKGLAMRRMGNVILIAPSEEIAAREKLELEARKQIEELAPLRAEFIQINYAKAADIAELLKRKENSILSPRGSVTVDERTNILLVQDTAEKLEEIRRLVAKLDVPVRQVLIESRIVIASDDFVKDLGVRFGYSKNQSYETVHQLWLGGTNEGTTSFPSVTAFESPAGSGNEGLIVNLPATPARGTAAALGLAVGK